MIRKIDNKICEYHNDEELCELLTTFKEIIAKVNEQKQNEIRALRSRIDKTYDDMAHEKFNENFMGVM